MLASNQRLQTLAETAAKKIFLSQKGLDFRCKRSVTVRVLWSTIGVPGILPRRHFRQCGASVVMARDAVLSEERIPTCRAASS